MNTTYYVICMSCVMYALLLQNLSTESITIIEVVVQSVLLLGAAVCGCMCCIAAAAV